MTLAERLRSRIADEGPLPFETFQAVALYDEAGGFFSSERLRSTRSGDFLTSPEVSPKFGSTLARFVDAEWRRLGRPAGFTLIEVAAGSGSLLGPLLAEVESGPAVWAVEVSPAARAALGELAGISVAAGLDEVPAPISGVIVANELIDNLPVALAVRTAGGWEERHVGLGEDGLALVPVPARPDVARWADRYGGKVPEGGMVEVQLEAAAWVERALDKLERGSLLLIDYGDTAEGLEPRRTQGTLRTYRSHHLGPDPLAAPGETDITVDVNFTALVDVAERAGASTEYLRQDDFLTGLGLRAELGRLRHRELELAAGDDPMARLRVRSERNEAETLLHPRGLGDFRVLIARR